MVLLYIWIGIYVYICMHLLGNTTPQTTTMKKTICDFPFNGMNRVCNKSSRRQPTRATKKKVSNCLQWQTGNSDNLWTSFCLAVWAPEISSSHKTFFFLLSWKSTVIIIAAAMKEYSKSLLNLLIFLSCEKTIEWNECFYCLIKWTFSRGYIGAGRSTKSIKIEMRAGQEYSIQTVVNGRQTMTKNTPWGCIRPFPLWRRNAIHTQRKLMTLIIAITIGSRQCIVDMCVARSQRI